MSRRAPAYWLLLLLCLSGAANGHAAEVWEAWTPRQKRAWIYERLVAPVRDVVQRQLYVAKLAAMEDVELDRTIASQFRQAAFAQQLAARQSQVGWGRAGVVGYRPMITWLPSGTQFSASGLVSRDRRHVRMSLTPFFSTIPRVDTFNYRTGVSRNVYGAQPRVPRRSAADDVRPRHAWYKNIRTLR